MDSTERIENEFNHFLNALKTCKCCGAILFEIDPEDICMDCVDIECNVKD